MAPQPAPSLRPPARAARYEIAQENKRLSEPLARSLKEVEALRSQLATHQKDKASLAAAKARLAASEKRVRGQARVCVRGSVPGGRALAWAQGCMVGRRRCARVQRCWRVAQSAPVMRSGRRLPLTRQGGGNTGLRGNRGPDQGPRYPTPPPRRRQIKALEWENEVLTQQMAAAGEERDGLRAQLDGGALDVQQKPGAGGEPTASGEPRAKRESRASTESGGLHIAAPGCVHGLKFRRRPQRTATLRAGLRSLLLEKRIAALSGALEAKEVALGEAIAAAAHADPGALQQVRCVCRVGVRASGAARPGRGPPKRCRPPPPASASTARPPPSLLR